MLLLSVIPISKIYKSWLSSKFKLTSQIPSSATTVNVLVTRPQNVETNLTYVHTVAAVIVIPTNKVVKTKCPNCSGEHLSFPQECPTWKLEKEVLQIKNDQNISFLGKIYFAALVIQQIVF